MSRALFATKTLSLAAAATVFAVGLVGVAVGNAAAECASGWEFGPTLRLVQSDGWSVSVGASGRAIGGGAVAVPPDRGALWRGTGEGARARRFPCSGALSRRASHYPLTKWRLCRSTVPLSWV